MNNSPCKYCGYPLSPKATECPQCRAGTPYGLWLEADQELSRPTLIKCPACGNDISNQAHACPRCGQPLRQIPQPPPTPIVQPRPRPRKNNPILIGCLLLVAVPAACVVIAKIIGGIGTRNANQNASSRPIASSTATPTPEVADESPGFSTERSREILGAFFIKPTLRQMLNDPDSLQDFQVLSVTPTKITGVYKATVLYRAKNGFGALVAQRQTFMITRGVGNGLDAWRVTPVKN